MRHIGSGLVVLSVSRLKKRVARIEKQTLDPNFLRSIFLESDIIFAVCLDFIIILLGPQDF